MSQQKNDDSDWWGVGQFSFNDFPERHLYAKAEAAEVFRDGFLAPEEFHTICIATFGAPLGTDIFRFGIYRSESVRLTLSDHLEAIRAGGCWVCGKPQTIFPAVYPLTISHGSWVHRECFFKWERAKEAAAQADFESALADWQEHSQIDIHEAGIKPIRHKCPKVPCNICGLYNTFGDLEWLPEEPGYARAWRHGFDCHGRFFDASNVYDPSSAFDRLAEKRDEP